MLIGSVYVAKELSSTAQPLLLCEFTLADGTVFRCSTHPLSSVYGGIPTSGSYEYRGNPWDPRVLNQDIGATMAMSDLGVDVPPTATVILADPDKTLFTAYETAIGFKGAILKLYSVFWDAGDATTGSFSDDSSAPVKFIGTCGSGQMDQGTLTVSATSLLNFTQKQMPPQRIQQVCSWSFPPTDEAQSDGLNNPFSIFYNCGYSYSQAGGVGNPQPSTTASFRFCDYSRKGCIARLGNPDVQDPPTPSEVPPIAYDLLGNATGRFGGYEWSPPTLGGYQRPYLSGKWETIINASSAAIYGEFMPLCYGTTWVNPLVMGIWGDGNYTHLEVAICSGKVTRIQKVLVNGIEVPCANPDTDPAYRPSDNAIPSAVQTFDYKNGYWKTINDGRRNGLPSTNQGWGRQGDPYGSVASIFIRVLRQVAAENSVPTVAVLLDGVQVAVTDSEDVTTFQFSTNPAWILKDLLLKAGWLEENINVPSFLEAANVCDTIVKFDSMSGDYQNFYNESDNPPFRRFSAGFMVKQRTSFGDLIRGVRANMRAMLFFDFNTGQLTLKIKQTLADQQTEPIVGSNYSDPVESVTAAGDESEGYVAYNFDQSNIVKQQGGKSTLVISQRSLQDSPNKTSLSFLNRENSYSTDSVTVVDVEDVNRVGQETAGSMPVVGVQTFDHARRILNNWLAENYRGNPRADYLGSAIGDTGGTLVFTFETSVKALHLMVGQICMVSDAQSGISNQLIRILRIKPSVNFETCQLVAVWHNDNWYQDTFGQTEQPIYGPAQGFSARAPYSWRPGYEVPIEGDAYYGVTDCSFQVFPVYSLAADNTGIANLAITGKVPVNAFPSLLKKPRVELIGFPDTGGNFPGGTAYFAAVAEKDGTSTTAGLGATSETVVIKLMDSDSALTFVVQAWPGRPLGFAVFAGHDPLAMSFQDEFEGTTGVVKLTNIFQEGSWEPPDEAFHNFRWRVRKVRHGGLWAEGLPFVFTPPLVTDGTIKISVYENYGMVPDEYVGYEVSVYSLAPRDGNTNTPVPIATFHVNGNNADTLFVSGPNPTTVVSGGLVSGDLLVMRMKPVFGEDENGKYFEDLKLINTLNPLYDTRLVASATNTTPIRITLDLTGGETFPFDDADEVVLEGIGGNLAANGHFSISNVDVDTASFDLDDSSGNGDYVNGGTASHQGRGLAVNYEQDSTAFVIAGTGRGTFVRIKSNTQTRVYIDGEWPVDPDDSTRLIIVEAVPVVDVPASPTNNAVREFVSTQLVELNNYDKTALLIHASMESRSGRASHIVLDPFREIYLVGNPFISPTDLPGPATFQVRAEGYAMITMNDLRLDDSAYAVKEMNWLMPSLDETDPMWVLAEIDGTSDPAEVTLHRADSFPGRFGSDFAVGDFILWNDPSMNSVTHSPNYEINQIIQISPMFMVKRRGDGAPDGEAMFGSRKVAHSRRIFKLIPRIFSQAIRQNTFGTLAPATVSGLPEKWEYAWANKCVAAVMSQPVGELGPGATQLVNCAQKNLVQNNEPRCPGLRTQNGAAYHLGATGDLAVGTVADFRVTVQSWESIRCVYGMLKTKSTGATDGVTIKVHVVWIGQTPIFEHPDDPMDRAQRPVYLIDTITFGESQSSFGTDPANAPAARQMPYHADGWGSADWPPNVLGLCADGLDEDGKLQLPISPNYASLAQFAPDGEIDFIIETVGSTAPGTDLVITVQT